MDQNQNSQDDLLEKSTIKQIRRQSHMFSQNMQFLQKSRVSTRKFNKIVFGENIFECLKIPSGQRNENQIKCISQYLSKFQYFQELAEITKDPDTTKEMLKSISQNMIYQKYVSTELVYNQNAATRFFYIILEGQVGFYYRGEQENQQKKQKDKDNIVKKKDEKEEEYKKKGENTGIQQIQQNYDSEEEEEQLDDYDGSDDEDYKRKYKKQQLKKIKIQQKLEEQETKDKEFLKFVVGGVETKKKFNQVSDINSLVLCEQKGPGEVFGIKPLVLNQPNFDFAIAMKETQLVIMFRDQFNQHLYQHEKLKCSYEIRYILDLPVFQGITYKEVVNIYLKSFNQTFKRNQVIFKEEDESQAAYITKKGEFHFYKMFKNNANNNINQEEKVETYKSKAYLEVQKKKAIKNIKIIIAGERELIGEEDIIEDQQRHYSLINVQPRGEAIMIPRQVLQEVLDQNLKIQYLINQRSRFKMQNFMFRVFQIEKNLEKYGGLLFQNENQQKKAQGKQIQYAEKLLNEASDDKQLQSNPQKVYTILKNIDNEENNKQQKLDQEDQKKFMQKKLYLIQLQQKQSAYISNIKFQKEILQAFQLGIQSLEDLNEENMMTDNQQQNRNKIKNLKSEAQEKQINEMFNQMRKENIQHLNQKLNEKQQNGEVLWENQPDKNYLYYNITEDDIKSEYDFYNPEKIQQNEIQKQKKTAQQKIIFNHAQSEKNLLKKRQIIWQYPLFDKKIIQSQRSVSQHNSNKKDALYFDGDYKQEKMTKNNSIDILKQKYKHILPDFKSSANYLKDQIKKPLQNKQILLNYQKKYNLQFQEIETQENQYYFNNILTNLPRSQTSNNIIFENRIKKSQTFYQSSNNNNISNNNPTPSQKNTMTNIPLTPKNTMTNILYDSIDYDEVIIPSSVEPNRVNTNKKIPQQSFTKKHITPSIKSKKDGFLIFDKLLIQKEQQLKKELKNSQQQN